MFIFELSTYICLLSYLKFEVIKIMSLYNPNVFLDNYALCQEQNMVSMYSQSNGKTGYFILLHYQTAEQKCDGYH